MPVVRDEVEELLDAGPDEEALERLLTKWQRERDNPAREEDYDDTIMDAKNWDDLVSHILWRPDWHWALATVLRFNVCDVNHRYGKEEQPFLITAAGLGEPVCTNLLLQHGADSNVVDASGQTPLLAAAEGYRFSSNRTYETALLLLDHGASTDIEDNEGYTALNFAYWRFDMLVYRLLTARRAIWGTTQAFPPSLHHNTLLGNTAGVRDCLANGDPVDCYDIDGRAPLHIAAASGNTAMVQLLLEKGAKVDMPTSATADRILDEDALRNQTPLHFAAMYGHIPVAELLLTAGADIELPDSYGFTPLTHAAKCPSWVKEEDDSAEAMTLYLLGKGADVRGDGILFNLCHMGSASMVEIILAGSKIAWSAEELACGVRNAVCCEHDDNLGPLARYGADVSVVEAVRWSGDIEIVRAAIARGRNINEEESLEWDRANSYRIPLTRSEGRTPLMIAAEAGRSDLVRLLLEHGADPNRRRNVRTALDYAESGGHTDCITLLRPATK